MTGAKIGPTLRVLVLGEVGISNVAKMDDNNLSVVVLHEDRLFLRIRRHPLNLPRRIERHLSATPDVTFLGEGGFHSGSSPVSPYLLNAS